MYGLQEMAVVWDDLSAEVQIEIYRCTATLLELSEGLEGKHLGVIVNG